MTSDPAMDFFREEARRQGISLREYGRRNGIIVPSKWRDIDAHEVPLDSLPAYIDEVDAEAWAKADLSGSTTPSNPELGHRHSRPMPGVE